MTHAERIRGQQWRWFVAAALFVCVLFAAAFVWRGQVSAKETSSPPWFTHQKHLAAGVPCLFCHPGVLTGPVAGIPTVEKCVGCHQSVDAKTDLGKATIAQVMEASQQQKGLQWPKVYDIPDFVHFNHQPHISAGFNCERCHGNVAGMNVAHVAYRVNMGFCLACHRSQPSPLNTHLEQCFTCHR